jgi:hypothetical protein
MIRRIRETREKLRRRRGRWGQRKWSQDRIRCFTTTASLIEAISIWTGFGLFANNFSNEDLRLRRANAKYRALASCLVASDSAGLRDGAVIMLNKRSVQTVYSNGCQGWLR